MKSQTYTILLADDSEDDAFLVKRAVEKSGIVNPIQWVKDGAEAIAYLTGEGRYADRVTFPFPELIILDVKMPGMSGLDVLAWLRDNPDLRVIPAIVMSSSQHDSDVRQAYNLGANTYFVKPSSFDELGRLIKTLDEYWELSIKPKAA